MSKFCPTCQAKLLAETEQQILAALEAKDYQAVRLLAEKPLSWGDVQRKIHTGGKKPTMLLPVVERPGAGTTTKKVAGKRVTTHREGYKHGATPVGPMTSRRREWERADVGDVHEYSDGSKYKKQPDGTWLKLTEEEAKRHVVTKPHIKYDTRKEMTEPRTPAGILPTHKPTTLIPSPAAVKPKKVVKPAAHPAMQHEPTKAPASKPAKPRRTKKEREATKHEQATKRGVDIKEAHRKMFKALQDSKDAKQLKKELASEIQAAVEMKDYALVAELSKLASEAMKSFEQATK